jgi:hypothetical protein
MERGQQRSSPLLPSQFKTVPQGTYNRRVWWKDTTDSESITCATNLSPTYSNPGAVERMTDDTVTTYISSDMVS